jgi:dienelactone hydrolase
MVPVRSPQGAGGNDNGRMAHVVMFHSAYGLREAELTAAERLRAAGHDVLTPDMYAGDPVNSRTGRLSKYHWSQVANSL